MTTLANTSSSGKFVDSCGHDSAPPEPLEQALRRLKQDLPSDAYLSVSHTTELMRFTDGAEKRVDRWHCVIRCHGEHQHIGSGRTANDAVSDALSKMEGEKIAALRYRQQAKFDMEHEPERFQVQ